MENRTLRVDPDKPGFLYQYERCNGKWWPLKKCWMHTEYYDFTDKTLRLKLKNMGFKLKVIK